MQFVYLKLEGQSVVRTRDHRLSKPAALTTAAGPPPSAGESHVHPVLRCDQAANYKGMQGYIVAFISRVSE